MYVDISTKQFTRFTQNSVFQLPQRWDGDNFYLTIQKLFDKYLQEIKQHISSSDYLNIECICLWIKESIDLYFQGLTENAFAKFGEAMELLIKNPLKIYSDTGWMDPFFDNDSQLKLYRVRNVQQNKLYSRKDIFHTPYNLRSKVATCRYSIAGCPSLYLGTSLDLCCEESQKTSMTELQIASKFELMTELKNADNRIEVIELAVKPQDFIGEANKDEKQPHKRIFKGMKLLNVKTSGNYLYWYPLIAACSYIRVSKKDPFAAEYLIPQFLMQWVRKQSLKGEVYGIRYFSCASVRASNMGCNYVFPASGERSPKDENFCKILSRAFSLTIPQYIHEYNLISDCENALKNDVYLEYI